MKTMILDKNDPKWLEEDFPCYELQEALIYKDDVCVVEAISGNNDEVRYELLSLDEYFEKLKSDWVLEYQGVPCTLKELESLNKGVNYEFNPIIRKIKRSIPCHMDDDKR